jgi:Cu(I)/Ag(I) efflux system periplasmic protein CusF
MKRTAYLFISLAFFALSALPAAAEDHAMKHTEGKAATQAHQGKGTINSVDAKAGKINITHEPIASLGWSGMTMDFEMQDKAVLANLKKGQKVRFKLVEARKGNYVISEITVVK